MVPSRLSSCALSASNSCPGGHSGRTPGRHMQLKGISAVLALVMFGPVTHLAGPRSFASPPSPPVPLIVGAVLQSYRGPYSRSIAQPHCGPCSCAGQCGLRVKRSQHAGVPGDPHSTQTSGAVRALFLTPASGGQDGGPLQIMPGVEQQVLSVMPPNTGAGTKQAGVPGALSGTGGSAQEETGKSRHGLAPASVGQPSQRPSPCAVQFKM